MERKVQIPAMMTSTNASAASNLPPDTRLRTPIMVEGLLDGLVCVAITKLLFLQFRFQGESSAGCDLFSRCKTG